VGHVSPRALGGGGHASQILVASALGISGIMRERAMSRSGMSKRRCKWIEMSPKFVCVALPRRGACRKAIKAARRPSSAVITKGAVVGSWRGVSPLVCICSDAIAGWVTVWSAGGVRGSLCVHVFRF